MTRKQIVDVSMIALIMTMLVWGFIMFYPLFFFRALLLCAGTLAVFIPIFFIVAVVVTKGSILPNPYHIPIIVIKKTMKEKN